MKEPSVYVPRNVVQVFVDEKYLHNDLTLQAIVRSPDRSDETIKFKHQHTHEAYIDLFSFILADYFDLQLEKRSATASEPGVLPDQVFEFFDKRSNEDIAMDSVQTLNSLPLTAREGASFGALLDNLKEALQSLSEYLRGINDPDVLTQELSTIRKYIDASLVFFEDDRYTNAEMPGEVAIGLMEKLKKINLTKLSEQAAIWVKIIIDALKFLKGVGS